MLSKFREVDLLFVALNRLECANGRMNDFEAENVLRRKLTELNEGETILLANQTLHEKRHLIPKDDAEEVMKRLHTKFLALRRQGLLLKQKQQQTQSASV